MAVGKTRKVKAEEYARKYSHIPLDYRERLAYLYDIYNLENKPDRAQMVIDKGNAMMQNLQWFDLQVVILYEEPEGASRPKFRVINRKNFHNEAMVNSQFVHVYIPGAADDFQFMRRMVGGELMALEGQINTPVNIVYNAYYKTPSYFNDIDTITAERGLIRPDSNKPDWDNLGKKYCDMYNHNVWIDDSSVIDAAVHKYFSVLPRVEIQMRYLNVVYNKQQYNKIVKRKEYDGTPLGYLDSKGGIVI